MRAGRAVAPYLSFTCLLVMVTWIDAIPYITDCLAESSGSSIHVTLKWSVPNKEALSYRQYPISCNCSEYAVNSKKSIVNAFCYWRKSGCYYTFSLDTCVDQCVCQVYGQRRQHPFNSSYWSQPKTCKIGPMAPRAPPVVAGSINKVNKERLLQVTLMIPKPLQKWYCDTDFVESISVDLTQNSGIWCDYNVSGIDIRKINDSYRFTVEFDKCSHLNFWSCTNVSLSVHNSIGQSPFSSPYTVRGAINKDIGAGSYTLLMGNVTNNSVSFDWSLNDTLRSMVVGKFIVGSHYELKLDDILVEENDTENTNFTLSNLSPGKQYLVCAHLITDDTDSWFPDSKCKNVEIKQEGVPATPDDNHRIVVIVIAVLLVALPLLALILSIVVCFLRPYCSKVSEQRTAERNLPDMITYVSSHVPSISRLGSSDIEEISQVSSSNENDSSSPQGEYVQLHSWM